MGSRTPLFADATTTTTTTTARRTSTAAASRGAAAYVAQRGEQGITADVERPAAWDDCDHQLAAAAGAAAARVDAPLGRNR